MKNESITYGGKEYSRFTLTRRQHREVFPVQKLRWCDKYRYYINDDEIRVLRYTNFLGKLVMTLIFPALLLVNGIAHTKEMAKELGDIWFQIDRNTYTDLGTASKGSETYNNVMRLVWGDGGRC